MTEADCRPETGYTPLFDGSATTGWKQAGPGVTLADSTLTSYGGLGMLWYSAKEFTGDSPSSSTGRPPAMTTRASSSASPASDDPWSAVNNGYEIQIDATDAVDRTTGAVYGFKSADITARDAALNPPGEWNTYELRVTGERHGDLPQRAQDQRLHQYRPRAQPPAGPHRPPEPR
ncbi:hypothetical protein SHIRM173S_01611 [Streptomyces hirsutus]